LQLCKAGAEGPCTRNICFGGTGYHGHKDECRVGKRPPRSDRELSAGGCVVGAVTGAIIAEFGTAGLAPEAGAIGGCAVGAAVL
jgi:hypothetical protein